jgi:hypothetical protein
VKSSARTKPLAPASTPRWKPWPSTSSPPPSPNAATITDKLELRVGKDLQYIRVNGTLVGFILGAAISLATLALPGAH